nr:hypothetical protein Iba_chr14fCG6810 [Ipomoea batatas]
MASSTEEGQRRLNVGSVGCGFRSVYGRNGEEMAVDCGFKLGGEEMERSDVGRSEETETYGRDEEARRMQIWFSPQTTGKHLREMCPTKWDFDCGDEEMVNCDIEGAMKELEVVTFGNHVGEVKEVDDELIGDEMERCEGVEKEIVGCDDEGAMKICEVVTFGNNVEVLIIVTHAFIEYPFVDIVTN